MPLTVVLVLITAVASAVAAGPADGLAGAWSGHWQAESGGARGSAELIVTETRDPGRVVGQFTFVHGAKSWTARREGVVVDDRARFELPGGGTILLRPEGKDHLSGEFAAPAGPLPTTTGRFALSRAR